MTTIENYGIPEINGEILGYESVSKPWPMQRVKAWYVLAPVYWRFLAAGWFWLFLSLVIGREQPSAGAMLCCAGILAEFSLRRLPWKNKLKQHFSDRDGKQVHKQYYVHKSDSEFAGGLAYRRYNPSQQYAIENNLPTIHQPDFYKVVSVCRKSDFQYPMAEPLVHVLAIEQRIDKFLNYCGMGTILIGTAFWGYGHLLFPSPCICT